MSACPKGVRITVAIGVEQNAQLDAWARTISVSKSDLVSIAIAEWLTKHRNDAVHPDLPQPGATT